MVSDEKTRKPLHDAAAAAELFDRLSAAGQAAIIQQMKDLLAQMVGFKAVAKTSQKEPPGSWHSRGVRCRLRWNNAGTHHRAFHLGYAYYMPRKKQSQYPVLSILRQEALHLLYDECFFFVT